MQDFLLEGGNFSGDNESNRQCVKDAILGGSGGMSPPPKNFRKNPVRPPPPPSVRNPVQCDIASR